MSTQVLTLFQPDIVADRYRRYRQLRAAEPVHWNPFFNAWALTRYDDIAAVLRDTRFAARPPGASSAWSRIRAWASSRAAPRPLPTRAWRVARSSSVSVTRCLMRGDSSAA